MPSMKNFQFLREKDQFIGFLWSKLQRVEAVECLYCGSLIQPEEPRCPKCGWTWENPSNDGTGNLS